MKLFSYPHCVWFVKSNESLSNAIVFLMTISTVLIIRFWTVVYCVFNLTEKNFRQENHELPHNRYVSRIYTGRKTSTLFAIYNNIAPFCYWHKNRENVAPTGKHSSKKKKKTREDGDGATERRTTDGGSFYSTGAISRHLRNVTTGRRAAGWRCRGEDGDATAPRTTVVTERK